MELPRELVYEDRKDIKEFGINNESSINHLIYEEWLLNRIELQPFKAGLSKRRLKVFNDAYYICTLILMHRTYEDFASYANERCSTPSLVFPMVYLYISKVRDKDYDNSRLLKDIETGLKAEGWEDNLNELIQRTSNYTFNLSSSEFAHRKLTPEILNIMKWYKITGGYKKDDILKIVRYISRDKNEWVMMLDAIKNAASEYEWEYNQDLNYVDDDGQWCQETPKDMSPIYQYCDELKDNYEELSIKTEKAPTLADGDKSIIGNTISTEIDFQTPNKKDKIKRGRPRAKQFEEYLKSDAPVGLMDELEKMLKDKKGIEAARIIIAITKIWIDDPKTESICRRFPSVKHSAYNNAKDKHYGTNSYQDKAKPFTEEELESIRTEIKNKLGLQ